jgi:hypothetical protein
MNPTTAASVSWSFCRKFKEKVQWNKGIEDKGLWGIVLIKGLPRNTERRDAQRPAAAGVIRFVFRIEQLDLK